MRSCAWKVFKNFSNKAALPKRKPLKPLHHYASKSPRFSCLLLRTLPSWQADASKSRNKQRPKVRATDLQQPLAQPARRNVLDKLLRLKVFRLLNVQQLSPFEGATY